MSHASPCRSFGCFQLGFLRSLFDQFHLAGQLVAFQPEYEISLENDGLIRSKQCSMLFNVLFSGQDGMFPGKIMIFGDTVFGFICLMIFFGIHHQTAGFEESEKRTRLDDDHALSAQSPFAV